MKFVKIILISVFMLMNITFVSGCDMYTEFYIEHSENLQFLIGEEFADENLKGLAKTILNTTVDITDEMIIVLLY